MLTWAYISQFTHPHPRTYGLFDRADNVFTVFLGIEKRGFSLDNSVVRFFLAIYFASTVYNTQYR